MSWTSLKNGIATVIKTNGNQEITGNALQGVLNSMVNALGAHATFAGFAIPSTSPGTPDGPVFYFAFQEGSYPNFGSTPFVVSEGEFGVFVWNGTTWSTIKYTPGVDLNEIVSELSALSLKISDVNNKIDEIPFEEGYYINANGNKGTLSSGSITDFVKVNAGEKWCFSGYSSSSGLYNVWGYSDNSESGTKTGLLASLHNYSKEVFTIPSGVNYIRAWGNTSNAPMLFKQCAINPRLSDVEAHNESIDNNIEILNKGFGLYPFTEGYYISQTGGKAALGSGSISDFIPVNEGEEWLFTGYSPAASPIYNIFGYSDKSESAAISGLLVGNVHYTNEPFTIPSGFKYIRAWGLTSNGVSVSLKTSVFPRLSAIENLVANYQTVETEVIGKSETHPFSEYTSNEYYSMSDGTSQGTNNSYKSKIYAIPSWASNIKAVFPSAHNSFGVLLYDSSMNFIESYKAAESVEIDLADTNAAYVAIQAYASWSTSSLKIYNDGKLKSLDEEVQTLKEETSAIMSYQDTMSIANISAANNGSNTWLIINKNQVAAHSGYLTKFRFLATDANSSFYVCVIKLRDSRFELMRRQLVSATTTGINEADINLWVDEGDYVGVQGDGTNTLPKYGGSVTDGWYWLTASGSAISIGTLFTPTYLANYSMAYGWLLAYSQFAFSSQVPQEVKVTTITATRNADNYNSIREIIASITDASATNQYIIYVPNGEWFECDIQGKEYVSIVGEDRERTILYCDGTADKITPSDYSYNEQAESSLSSINMIYKHCIFVKKSIDVRNITIRVNDAKYCVHMDNGGFKKCQFVNCHFIAGVNTNFPIGIGIRGEQSINIKECVIERIEDNKRGIFAHNWNNQNYPSEINITNCYFKNCGFISLDELGSEQEDAWTLLNCYSDGDASVNWSVDVTSNNTTYWTNPTTGQKETDPTAVPYCIKINCLGSNVRKIVKQLFSPTSTIARPNADDYTIVNKPNSGSSRPSSPFVGMQYFDETLSKPIWYSSNGWVDATGTSV